MDFYLLLKKMGTHLSNKYRQKILCRAKRSTADAIKTASTGFLIGNKITDKITSVSRKSNRKLSNNGT